jgi:hypothetical protein
MNLSKPRNARLAYIFPSKVAQRNIRRRIKYSTTREPLRMTRGRYGALALYRMTLAFTTSCRFVRRTKGTK